MFVSFFSLFMRSTEFNECVPLSSYEQRPATELVRAVNKFKADFGGHIVCLERVQPSADHVPHRFSTC